MLVEGVIRGGRGKRGEKKRGEKSGMEISGLEGVCRPDKLPVRKEIVDFFFLKFCLAHLLPLCPLTLTPLPLDVEKRSSIGPATSVLTRPPGINATCVECVCVCVCVCLCVRVCVVRKRTAGGGGGGEDGEDNVTCW